MGMRNPPHPGEIIRYECLEPLGLDGHTRGARAGSNPSGTVGPGQ